MSGSSNFNIKSDHIRQKLSDLDIAVSDKYEVIHRNYQSLFL